jgi:hypothetical protein
VERESCNHNAVPDGRPGNPCLNMAPAQNFTCNFPFFRQKLSAMAVQSDKKGMEDVVPVQTGLGISGRTIAPHTLGVRVMLLTTRPDGECAQRLASYGSLVDVEGELFAALSGMIDDPMGYDLFVMDCDAFGGIEGAERAISTLVAADARMRVMLISDEFDVPAYPLGRRTAVCLPGWISEAGFRRGFDHVLRDRAAMTMM